ncbi:Hypothetical protein SRAE_2000058300 [Strongyloides ratti]|uniref:Uncharacterized protein n=1 Tax=Strongyloides ratti TaxID=34506 RepID=A0A090MXR8_STRRB|nr:Hypothetical protein SRAE_2000058300 [Strongyloides ratti]CEF65909.1 Hypothetical protein SRAE_2000058300 [Strongyloides ratti]
MISWEEEVKAREAKIAEERLQQRIRDRKEKEQQAIEEERRRKEEEHQREIEAEKERARQAALAQQKQKEKTIADTDENWRRRPDNSDSQKTAPSVPRVIERKNIPKSNPYGNAKPLEVKRTTPLTDNPMGSVGKRVIESGNRGFNYTKNIKTEADVDDNWRKGPAPSSVSNSSSSAPRSGNNEHQQQSNNTDSEGWSINSNKRASSGRQENTTSTSSAYRPPHKQMDRGDNRRSNQTYGNNTNTRNIGSNRSRNNQSNTGGSDSSSWR